MKKNILANELGKQLENTFLDRPKQIVTGINLKNYRSHVSSKTLVLKKIECNDDYEELYDIYIDSIDFCDGYMGKIDYFGCNDNKPNLSKNDITINIPFNVNVVIARLTLETQETTIRTHILLDLSLKKGDFLSVIKSGGECDTNLKKKYSVLVLHNDIPNHYKLVNPLSHYTIHLLSRK